MLLRHVSAALVRSQDTSQRLITRGLQAEVIEGTTAYGMGRPLDVLNINHQTDRDMTHSIRVLRCRERPTQDTRVQIIRSLAEVAVVVPVLCLLRVSQVRVVHYPV